MLQWLVGLPRCFFFACCMYHIEYIVVCIARDACIICAVTGLFATQCAWCTDYCAMCMHSVLHVWHGVYCWMHCVCDVRIIDLRTAQVYWDAIFLISQEVYLNFHHFLWVKLWVGWVGRGYIEISRYFPALWINRVTLVTKIKLWYSLGY